MTDRTPDRALDSWDRASPSAPPSAPGKRSLTQSLAPRPIILRVAHDDPRVADHAAAAVDRAATSSGEPLRADLRERFERSLGVDLGGVRVHRGADSAAASDAVGARAYTVGNDIHFGAGQYVPDDPFGLHLLAHEVAHTAQQAGAAPTRQHKLAVSGPADSAEVEADRAADAMVAGASFAVTGGPAGGLARKASPEDDARKRYESEADATAIELSKIDSARASTPAGPARDALEQRRAEMIARNTEANRNLRTLTGSDAQARAAAVAAGSQPRAPESYQVKGGPSTTAVGVGRGDRAGDLAGADPAQGMKRTNGELTIAEATSVPTPTLDKLPVTSSKQVGTPDGVHYGYEVRNGSASGTTPVGVNLGTTGPTGRPIAVDGPGAYAQTGGSASANAGVAAATGDERGTLTGKADVNAAAQYGASASAGVTERGASASAAAGASAEAKATVSGDYKTAPWQIDPQTQTDAGVGLSGSAGVSAGAGAGIGASVGKEEAGINFKAGAAIKAEAKGDIHGNVGPAAGKYEVGALAGVGAGAEGGIVYKDGKLTMGAKLYAALGYGATSGGEVTIDLRQSRDVGLAILKKARDQGVAGAQAAYNAADIDGDSKLTLNDPAAAASDAMRKQAKDVDRKVDSAIDALDADHDGRMSGRDLRMRAEQAHDKVVEKLDSNGDGQVGVDDAVDAGKKLGDKVHQKAEQTYDAAKKKVDEYETRAEKYVTEKTAQLEQAADRNHDGVIDGRDAEQAVSDGWDATKQGAEKGWDATKQGAEDAYDATKRGVERTWDATKQGAEKGWDATKQGAEDAYDATRKAADRDGDGQVGASDIVEGARQGGAWMKHKAAETVERTQQGLEHMEQSIEDGARKAKDGAIATYDKAHDAADLNGDGRVDGEDARLAAEKASLKAIELEEKAKKKLADGADQVMTKARDLEARAERAADRDGDGKLGVNDVAEGAKQLGAATAEKIDQAGQKLADAERAIEQKATAAKDEALAQASRAKDTLAKGLSDTGAQVSETGSKVKNFLFGKKKEEESEPVKSELWDAMTGDDDQS